jgi:hypothetical protein
MARKAKEVPATIVDRDAEFVAAAPGHRPKEGEWVLVRKDGKETAALYAEPGRWYGVDPHVEIFEPLRWRYQHADELK